MLDKELIYVCVYVIGLKIYDSHYIELEKCMIKLLCYN